jgi:hypothetical protein
VLRVSREFHRGGLKVFVDHGSGLVTTYNHLSRALVEPGQLVRRGEVVAISGYSGIDALVGFPWTPPHVHFNTWLNGEYVDPFTPLDSDAPSLWRNRNAPVPAGPQDLRDAELGERAWDEDALARALSACIHDGARAEIEGARTLDERAGAVLFQTLYFPTRFDRARLGKGFCPYAKRFPREPRLDLPFSHEDYDGVYFCPR